MKYGLFDILDIYYSIISLDLIRSLFINKLAFWHNVCFICDLVRIENL